jgi:hypothetical protein
MSTNMGSISYFYQFYWLGGYLVHAYNTNLNPIFDDWPGMGGYAAIFGD